MVFVMIKTNDNTQNTLAKPEIEKGTSLKTRMIC
jgi:hypothetical protein